MRSKREDCGRDNVNVTRLQVKQPSIVCLRCCDDRASYTYIAYTNQYFTERNVKPSYKPKVFLRGGKRLTQ